jgi:cyclopropane fatty-acyl-phospholipid synthase-like methyltransferase
MNAGHVGPRGGALWGAAWSAIPGDVAQRLAEGGTALEIGCGNGLACIALAEQFPAARISGHDPDPQAIARAALLARAAGVEDRVAFSVDDSTYLPRACCDLVAIWGVLGRLTDPCRLLNAIRNALVTEGTCLLLERPHDASEDDSLRALARAAGFSRVTSYNQPHLQTFDLRR